MKTPLSTGKHVKLAFILLITILLPSKVPAQVLNQKVSSLLDSACAGLGVDGFGTPGLVGNLARICDTQLGQVPVANSIGGLGASYQGSAVSILNTALLKRMEELKAEEEEEGEKSKKSTSMRFNPFGLLSAASLRNLSVSSPFYATMANGGGSSAGAFATSSQSRWNGLGFFGSGQVQALDRNVGSFQDGYNSMIYGVTVGVDYRFNKQFVAGFASNYANTNGSFTGGGAFSTNSYGGLAFASIQPTDKTFIQLTAGYTRNNYLVARQASVTAGEPDVPGGRPPYDEIGLASSTSNGDVVNSGILAGYDYPVGRFTVGPRLGVNYTHTHISAFSENGSTGVELRYDPQNIHSLQSLIGVQGSAAFSTRLGVLVPQFNADYIHEFANSQRLITVQFAEDLRGTPDFPGTTPTRFTFQNDVPVRNYFNLGTGLMAILPNGWQTFVNFRAMVGNNQFNNYVGTFGLRIEL